MMVPIKFQTLYKIIIPMTMSICYHLSVPDTYELLQTVRSEPGINSRRTGKENRNVGTTIFIRHSTTGTAGKVSVRQKRLFSLLS